MHFVTKLTIKNGNLNSVNKDDELYHRHHIWHPDRGYLCLEIQRDPIVPPVNHVAVRIRRRVRCVLGG